jgi:O-antigen/teichoic acid export membrane protein
MINLKQLLAPFKNIHFQSLMGNGIIAVFGLLTITVLYRTLSVKDIGVYVFFITIVTLIETFKTGFLNNSFIKFYTGTNKEQGSAIIGSAWCLALAISGGLIVINVIAFFWFLFKHDQEMIMFLKCFFIITIVTLPSYMSNLIVQGDKRFDRLLWLKLINQVLFTGLVIILAVLHKATLVSVIYCYIIGNIAASLTALLFNWTRIGTIRNTSKKYMADIFHFGKYSMGTTVSSNFFKVTDVFFINFFLGPAALAVYNLGGRLLQIIEIPITSFVASGLPGFSGYYNNNQNDAMMYMMKKMIGMLSIAIFVITCVCIIFAGQIIGLIGGAKYYHTEAPNLFRIFMTIAILYPADRFFAVMLDVIHKPKINFYKILVMLTVNLLGDYIGLTLFKSIYIVVIVNIFPVLAAIIISYFPLNNFYKFNFVDVYVVGYREIMLLLAKARTMFLAKVLKSKI